MLLVISFSVGAQSEGGVGEGTAQTTCLTGLLKNGGFELPVNTPGAGPLNWGTSQWFPSSQFSREEVNAHSGDKSARITAVTANDAWFSQEVTVEPETGYLLTGWIKTENVSYGAGANLSLVGTWTHTEGLSGTNDWTRVSLWFNSGASTRITVGARLGYWGSLSAGTAWFDDLRLTPIKPDGTHPRWKILVLIYDRTDAVVTDTGGVRHHLVGAMTRAEVERAALAATRFVETDIPALTSGNMIPELTIRYPERALTQFDPYGEGWWPSPANTAPERDPSFDSVIVIWEPRAVDQYTGNAYWVSGWAGIASSMGTGQTYSTVIAEATGYGHRNVFKHEWGHSILFYFDAAGTAPKPAVTNHAQVNQYVHWPTGEGYAWVDETDANPIPNSIYNNESGFTHDYYSGTTATADQPARRLGITPEAWMLGGPVTKPGVQPPSPPVITCNGDIAAASDPGACSAKVTLSPPAVFDACESNLRPVATRGDGMPADAAYPCGQTVITWSVTNAENLTSTCRQVVTVSDGEPPAFVHVPPPVTVTTGPGAASCGAVVDDAALGAATHGADPLVPDPTGDVIYPQPQRQSDITAISATYDGESVTFTVNFAGQVSPASSSEVYGLVGHIEIDTDQNPATGSPPTANFISPPPLNLGVEYAIDVGSESRHPGLVEVRARGGPVQAVGQVPIVFAEDSFTVKVPLALLGGDNGLVNYDAYMGVNAVGPSDRAPNGATPATSAPVPELIALDNCSGLRLSRSGVPPGNLFPVGGTLITYTATDAHGNAASVTQSVTVIDDTPPAITGVAVSPSTLWPPNHDMTDVTVSYEATDNCAVLETGLSVGSNEPGGGTGTDWEVVDAHHVRLRAEKSDRREERLYTVTITATDVHGNSSSRSVAVRVPRSRGKGSPKVYEAVGKRPDGPAPDALLTASSWASGPRRTSRGGREAVRGAVRPVRAVDHAGRN